MRRVRVATLSFRRYGEPDAQLERALELVRKAAPSQPDIIALPENFANDSNRPQSTPGPITDAMAEEARRIGCYIIVPLIKQEPDGTLYNVATLLDPQGDIVGEYRKMFPTDYEMEAGITPGVSAPTFETSFGRIGMAICFDLNFPEVVQELSDAGAEIIFFVSAYEGGRQLQRWALDHSVYIVSSHREGYGQVVDVSGQLLQKGDPVFNPILVRDLNLNRAVLHLDYNWKRFPDVIAKYGRSVHIDVYRPEAIAALESLEEGLNVREIMKEFGLETFAEYMARSRRLRDQALRGAPVKSGPLMTG